MGTRILISVHDRALAAELNDSKAAEALAAALPRTVQMTRWGEEYYGALPLNIVADNSAREIVEIGEIAYWPPGKALCLFFGPTPASTDGRPRAASPVLPLGRITDGLEVLKGLGPSAELAISAG